MRKLGGLILVAAACSSIALYFTKPDFGNTRAQTSDPNLQKKIERDNSVPQAKVQKAYGEAEFVLKSILSAVEKNLPKHSIQRSDISASAGIGRKGQIRFEAAWSKSRRTEISMNATFVFDEREALEIFKTSTGLIAIGEFYRAPDFVGPNGILVKNVHFHKKDTGVGLHFVKGRVIVHTHLTDYKRKNDRNEKELIEFVRLIEPLIVARPTFDEL